MELGVGDNRLRRADIRRVGRGIYMWEAPGLRIGEDVTDEAHEPGRMASAELQSLFRSISAKYPSTWVSHGTAARILGLPLPWRLKRQDDVHLSSQGKGQSYAGRPGVVRHRPVSCPGETFIKDGIRMSTPARIMIDLMPWLSVAELVVLGDAVVRRPYSYAEGRGQAWTSIEELKRTVDAHPWTPGVPRGREAVSLVRVGADSAPETRLRLALINGGLPEPELQVPADIDDPSSPRADLGYPWAKLAIQYDGEHHFAPAQQNRDQMRDATFEAHGWKVLLANQVDNRDGFRRLVSRTAHLLRG